MGSGFVVILSIQSCANTKKKSIKHRFLDGLNEIQKKKRKKLSVFQIFDNYLQC